MTGRALLWLHLLAFATFTGATAVLFAVAFRLRNTAPPPRPGSAVVETLRVYGPLALGALGVSILTGAWSLTAYKAALGGAFFERMGRVLAWKLLAVFILVILAAYVAFGLALPVVRRADAGELLDGAAARRLLRRLSWCAALALVLSGVILWLALALGHAAPVASAPGLRASLPPGGAAAR